jgi:hypothetical protein
MSSAEQVIRNIEAVGGVLTIHGDRIRCRIPEEACPLLEDLRASREEVLLLLLQRSAAPSMPRGVQLIQWNLKDPPILIESSAVVSDPALFALSTLKQLGSAIDNRKRWVGWSVPQLVERLAQVGVTVALDKEATIR